jgi:uracil-DNA glycosylase
MTSHNVEYIFEEDLCSNDSQLIVCFCYGSIKSKNTNENFLAMIKKYPYISDFLSSRKEDSKLGTIKVVGDKKQGQRLILLLFFQLDGKTSIDDSKKWFDKSLEKISSIKGLKSIAFPHDENYNTKIEDWSNQSSAKIYIVSNDPDPSKESSEEEEMNLSEEESEQNLSEEEEEIIEEEKPPVPEKDIPKPSSKKEESSDEEEEEQSSSSEDENSSDEEEEIVTKPQPAADFKQKIENLDSFISVKGGFQTPSVKVSSSKTKDYGEDYDFLKWFWAEMQTLPYINPLYFINSYEKRDCINSVVQVIPKKDESWYTSNILEYTKNNIPKTYETFFNQFIEGGGMDDLSPFLEKEVKNYKIYPDLPDIYKAFELCPLDKMKVVVLGQDPYHTEGVAMGVAFGHKANANRVQPSLKNVYKAVEKDGFKVNWNNGDITKWCTQGVFFINTALTVREGEAGSHLPKSKSQDGPWEYFTRQLLNFLDQEKEHLVIMLWGLKAQEYKEIFSTKKHFLITAPHPAASAHNPLNTEFFDSNCFSKANRKLKTWNIEQIDWNLE